MLQEIIQGVLAQSRLSIAQAISLIENNPKEGLKLLSDLYKHTGHAYSIGITGPPGAGKSSITNNLISAFRKKDNNVAVIAVDPTSPFSGGSVLGDRIRMTSHYSDPHVFIRSMATRGGQGGLALKTMEIGDVFDAAGFDIIIYETVGVGQIELDIIKAADTIVVVLVPEFGDEVQLLKAGLMEIGNIFSINKSDRPGANKLMIALENILSTISIDEGKWMPQIVQTVATEERGIDELVNSIESHSSFNQKLGIHNQKLDEQYIHLITELIKDDFAEKFWDDKNRLELQKELDKKHKERISPYVLANKMLQK